MQFIPNRPKGRTIIKNLWPLDLIMPTVTKNFVWEKFGKPSQWTTTIDVYLHFTSFLYDDDNDEKRNNDKVIHFAIIFLCITCSIMKNEYHYNVTICKNSKDDPLVNCNSCDPTWKTVN